MENQNKKLDTKLLFRVLGVARPFFGLFVMCIVLAIILAIISPVRPYLISRMVDDHITSYDIGGMKNLIILYLGVLVVTVLLRYIFIYYSAYLGQMVIKVMRMRVFKHIIHMRLGFLDKTPIGTSTTRTINDIESINNVFTQGVITMLADVMTVFAVIAMMFYTSWRLAIICMITLPFLIIASYIFKEKVKASYQIVRTKISTMNAFLQERISGMRVIQIFNAEKQEMKNFIDINKDYKQAWVNSIFYYAVFFPVVELISALTLALLIWIGAKGHFSNTVSLGALVAFPIYINQLFRPIRIIADKFNTLQMGLVAADRVFSILDNKAFIENEGNIDSGNLNGAITFDQVDFSYEEGHPVLKELSFSVSPGETLGIVGSTGSGKTTIINLINRFYDINAGSISIDGKDIKRYNLEHLRSRMSLVLQDVFLFHGSVADNIRLMDSSISVEKIIESSKTLGAHPFIESLPGGYDYVISERGGNLSVGQRQLISFVRALVFDPDILILDEATSSIDTETEAIIQYAIEKLIEKRTSIIIAHRLTTIKSADNILVMDQGIKVEFGPHDELMQIRDGRYRELYDLQFAETDIRI